MSATLFFVSGEGEASEDVALSDLWEIVLNLCGRQTRGQPAQHIANCDSHSANAGPTATLAWFECDDALVVHVVDSTVKVRERQAAQLRRFLLVSSTSHTHTSVMADMTIR